MSPARRARGSCARPMPTPVSAASTARRRWPWRASSRFSPAKTWRPTASARCRACGRSRRGTAPPWPSRRAGRWRAARFATWASRWRWSSPRPPMPPPTVPNGSTSTTRRSRPSSPRRRRWRRVRHSSMTRRRGISARGGPVATWTRSTRRLRAPPMSRRSISSTTGSSARRSKPGRRSAPTSPRRASTRSMTRRKRRT